LQKTAHSRAVFLLPLFTPLSYPAKRNRAPQRVAAGLVIGRIDDQVLLAASEPRDVPDLRVDVQEVAVLVNLWIVGVLAGKLDRPAEPQCISTVEEGLRFSRDYDSCTLLEQSWTP